MLPFVIAASLFIAVLILYDLQLRRIRRLLRARDGASPLLDVPWLSGMAVHAFVWSGDRKGLGNPALSGAVVRARLVMAAGLLPLAAIPWLLTRA